MDINKPNMLRFRVEFAKAVKSLEEEFEIKISLGTITMRGSEFSARLTGENVTLSESGIALQEESQFTLNAWLVGGDIENSYGKTYKQGNSSVTVVACNSNRPKYPMDVIKDGKKFKTTVGYVKSLMGSV